jgi:hypothetical protein
MIKVDRLCLACVVLWGCSGATGKSASGSGGVTGSADAAGGSGGSGSGGAGGSSSSGGAIAGSSGGGAGGPGGAADSGADKASTLDADALNTDGGDVGTGPVMPIMRNGHWAFDIDDMTFEVDPSFGGRITNLSIGQSGNLLTGPTIHPIYWGSTFWTSPESQWKQPPPTEIDSAPYTVTSTASSVTLTGPKSPLLGVSVSKTFSADRQKRAFQIEYKLINASANMVSMAPWEITRVIPGGITFFPTGTRSMLSMGATLPTTNSGGITWFSYDMAAVTADSKLIVDATEGWVAHVDKGIVIIKKFPDVPPAQIAPKEGDVELYTNKLHTYIEIEDQGPYASIASGASTSWTVTWFLRQLPAGVPATAGQAALAAFVRDTIR